MKHDFVLLEQKQLVQDWNVNREFVSFRYVGRPRGILSGKFRQPIITRIPSARLMFMCKRSTAKCVSKR
jgi:hypothetical protein